MWESLILFNVLTILRLVVKNPAKKAALREILLNIRDGINAAYPEDSGLPVPPSQ